MWEGIGDSSAGGRQWMLGSGRRLDRRRRNPGSRGFTVSFACIICTFTLVVIILCFCTCPLLLYHLREQLGFDYQVLLHTVVGFLAVGIVVECFLVAWRRGCLGSCCCCCRRDRGERGVPGVSGDLPTFNNGAFSDAYGSLRESTDLNGHPCGVHRRLSGPPPAYDLGSSADGEGKQPLALEDCRGKEGYVSDDADIEIMCDKLASAIGEDVQVAALGKHMPPPLSKDDSFRGLPNLNSFGTYLHLVEVQTPLSPKETVFNVQDK